MPNHARQSAAKIPVLLAWSGGKDSTLALADLRASNEYIVRGLLTSVTPAYDRISIHGVRREILRRQGDLLDLPIFEAATPVGADNAAYETAWADAIKRGMAATGPLSHIAYGDLFLDDVRQFREQQSVRLNYTPVFPLWGRDTRALANVFVDAGYEAYVTCVDTTQLDAEFAGRKYDGGFLSDLPASVDPCGERGEFHTCVVAGPVFGGSISVATGERVLRENRFQYCDLVPGDW